MNKQWFVCMSGCLFVCLFVCIRSVGCLTFTHGRGLEDVTNTSIHHELGSIELHHPALCLVVQSNWKRNTYLDTIFHRISTIFNYHPDIVDVYIHCESERGTSKVWNKNDMRRLICLLHLFIKTVCECNLEIVIRKNRWGRKPEKKWKLKGRFTVASMIIFCVWFSFISFLPFPFVTIYIFVHFFFLLTGTGRDLDLGFPDHVFHYRISFLSIYVFLPNPHTVLFQM